MARPSALGPPPAGTSRRALVGMAGTTLVALAVTALLGWRYHDTHGPGRLDGVVDPALAVAAPWARRLLWAIVLLGDPAVMVVLALLIAVWCAWARRPRAAVVAIVGPALAAGVSEYLAKPVVGRTLGGTEAYPSGHTVTVVAIATAAVVLALDTGHPRSPRGRTLLVGCAVGLPAAVAVSLVALGLHYTTDVVGGAGLSVGAVLAVALATGTGTRRAVPVWRPSPLDRARP